MKRTILSFALSGVAMLVSAQYTFDALQLSQTELRGTSRFMSMGGAFGALGGDLSVLNQNPGGIGVYRSNDIGVTINLDLNSSQAAGNDKVNQTKFNVNNFGYVGVLKLNSESVPNINWGVTFNRNNSFNRRSRGAAYDIPTSITNFFADQANFEGTKISDLDPSDPNVDPFFDRYAKWNQILAYRTYLINPADNAGTKFSGLGFEGVSGDAEYEIDERGHTDEFTISLGGNIANTLYWGMSLGITDMLYEYTRYYGEALENTVVYDAPDDPEAVLVDGNANLGIVDYNRTTGTGYNFKLGVILKPVNALRLGLAFHTPTYFKMKDSYYSVMRGEFYGNNVLPNQELVDQVNGYIEKDKPFDYYELEKNRYLVENESPTGIVHYKIRTPWRLIGSIAGVIGNKGILSADYEYVANTGIRILDDRGYEIAGAKQEIEDYLSASHIMRLGGEWRVTPNWSLRAGYSYQTSNADNGVKDNETVVVVGGSSTAYSFDRSVQNITAGFGYHYKNVYFDMAYVHKYRQNTYSAFPLDDYGYNVKWDVKDHTNRLTATLGFRF